MIRFGCAHNNTREPNSPRHASHGGVGVFVEMELLNMKKHEGAAIGRSAADTLCARTPATQSNMAATEMQVHWQAALSLTRRCERVCALLL